MSRRDDRTQAAYDRLGVEIRTERRSPATLEAPPTPDIAALETAAESLMRFGDTRNAVAMWSLALRLRMEATDAVT